MNSRIARLESTIRHLEQALKQKLPNISRNISTSLSIDHHVSNNAPSSSASNLIRDESKETSFDITYSNQTSEKATVTMTKQMTFFAIGCTTEDVDADNADDMPLS